MAIDPRVSILSVKSGIGFDPVTLQPVANKVVTYKVLTQGPFTATFTAAQFNETAVETALNAEVATLQAIGAIPPA
jgi:hypothetical protein